MQNNKRTETEPERLLRSELHRRGLRFRKDASVEAGGLKTKVDILFRQPKVAIFVDGCFWHQCPEHGTLPKLNAEFWREKLQSNVSRDKRVNAALEDDGWLVMRCWEHEPIDDAADRVVSTLLIRQDGLTPAREAK